MNRLCLDYDGTLSLFTDDQLAKLAAFIKAIDMTCLIVTYRSSTRDQGNDDVFRVAKLLDVGVRFSCGQAKASLFDDGHTIWLDDQPETVLFGADELADV